MAPVGSEGCCVRPSKPPNPSFSESLFLLRWVAGEALREKGTSGCPLGSSWDYGWAWARSWSRDDFSSDAAEQHCLTGLWCAGTGQRGEQTRVGLCVCTSEHNCLVCLFQSTRERGQPAVTSCLEQNVISVNHLVVLFIRGQHCPHSMSVYPYLVSAWRWSKPRTPLVDGTESANLKKGFECSSRHRLPCLFDLSLFSLSCCNNTH